MTTRARPERTRSQASARSRSDRAEWSTAARSPNWRRQSPGEDRGQRDLGNEPHGPPAGVERGGDRAQVDLGLPAAGDALEQRRRDTAAPGSRRARPPRRRPAPPSGGSPARRAARPGALPAPRLGAPARRREAVPFDASARTTEGDTPVSAAISAAVAGRDERRRGTRAPRRRAGCARGGARAPPPSSFTGVYASSLAAPSPTRDDRTDEPALLETAERLDPPRNRQVRDAHRLPRGETVQDLALRSARPRQGALLGDPIADGSGGRQAGRERALQDLSGRHEEALRDARRRREHLGRCRRARSRASRARPASLRPAAPPPRP